MDSSNLLVSQELIINGDDEPQVEEDQLIYSSSISSMAETSTSLVSRSTTDYFVMGKHRMAAAISSLDQQIQFIQVLFIIIIISSSMFIYIF